MTSPLTERKKITFDDSVFFVTHSHGIFYTECGKLNALINCPFYEVLFRDLVIKKETVKNNKYSFELKNYERHRCLLQDKIYGMRTGNDLWKTCPGEIVE